ncbi:hypothetical protein CWI36_2788p0010 [Hamiltosporidium magnivora]|uniref:Uncharacterized protein n=1 Tax=Hamiltosporidium magnivora TaxID=148818 RepID=A0A4Q9KS93_9MICR|nr:hypothetical protein CWI36_2788p0010 [Hamiltosporidium magnivora]
MTKRVKHKRRIICFRMYVISNLGRLASIDTTIARFQFVSILTNNLESSVRNFSLEEYIFQQDINSKYTSKVTVEFLKE